MNPILEVLSLIFRVMLFLAGALLVGATLSSAIRTFVLPRSSADPLTHFVFIVVRKIFDLTLRFVRSYDRRDRTMAFYAPVSLMALLPVWYFLVMLGYSVMYMAMGVSNWYGDFRLSVSSIVTLGFQNVDSPVTALLVFSEAVIGLILVALLLGYLPTMYAAFSRRESQVTLLEVRAGDPPSAAEMLKRYYRIQGLDRLGEVWRRWEEWFADIEESHTSLAALVFFRSPQPNHSWVTAAGTVLDAAALTLSSLDVTYDPQAALCIRGGYLALRHIAEYFKIDFPNNPKPTDQISITREEFNEVWADLQSQGLPMKTNQDQAWLDYSGWRVNYDRVLLALAQITMAPYAPWSSDRGFISDKIKGTPV